MKKIALIALLSLLAACGGDTTDPAAEGSTGGVSTGYLTIRNNSGCGLLLIHWTDGAGDKKFFSTTQLWSSLLQEYVSGMADGDSKTRTLNSGTSPVYFYFPAGGGKYETVSQISVIPGGTAAFTLTGETLVRESSLTSASKENRTTMKLVDVQ